MTEQSSEYFRNREQEELDAAAQASSDEARKIHLALAEGYAERARERRGKAKLTIKAV